MNYRNCVSRLFIGYLFGFIPLLLTAVKRQQTFCNLLHISCRFTWDKPSRRAATDSFTGYIKTIIIYLQWLLVAIGIRSQKEMDVVFAIPTGNKRGCLKFLLRQPLVVNLNQYTKTYTPG